MTSIPWYDREPMFKILDFFEDLITGVPVYDLYFRPGVELVERFREFIEHNDL